MLQKDMAISCASLLSRKDLAYCGSSYRRGKLGTNSILELRCFAVESCSTTLREEVLCFFHRRSEDLGRISDSRDGFFESGLEIGGSIYPCMSPVDLRRPAYGSSPTLVINSGMCARFRMESPIAFASSREKAAPYATWG